MNNRGGRQQQMSEYEPEDNQQAATEMAKQFGQYSKNQFSKVREADVELWGIMNDVPQLELKWAIMIAIFNVLLPGVGTMIASCLKDPSNWSKTQLATGFLQSATAIFILGWVWSLYWAYLFVTRAKGINRDE